MKTAAQLDLFEDFTPQGSRAPKLVLPIQRSKEIDAVRAREILGVNEKTLRRLLESGAISGYRHGGKHPRWHVAYDSIVEYCDRLRVLNGISDARRGLEGRKRYRDREVLPFPLDETVSLREVCQRLDIGYTAAVHLIEEGAIVGYQIVFEQPGCPWRIYAPSLDRYVLSLHERMRRRPSSPSSKGTPASR